MNEPEIAFYGAIVSGAVLMAIALKQESLEGKITILGIVVIIESLLIPYALYLHILIFRGLLNGLFDFMSTTSPEVSGIIMLAVTCLYLAPTVSMAVCMISNKEVAGYIMTLQRRRTISEIIENRKSLTKAPAG